MSGHRLRTAGDLHAARIAGSGRIAMIEDEVIREVRAVREAFAASHGYDIRTMVAALHEWGIASGRELVRLAWRPATITPPRELPATTDHVHQ
jgi:hypothetical protein